MHSFSTSSKHRLTECFLTHSLIFLPSDAFFFDKLKASPNRMLSNSFTYLLIYSFTHSLIHSFTHLLTTDYRLPTTNYYFFRFGIEKIRPKDDENPRTEW